MRRTAGLLIATITLALVAATSVAPVSSAQEPEPGYAPAVATFRGNYDGYSKPEVVGPVRLDAGLVVVHARHGGNANFVVSIVTQDPGKAPEDSYENRYLLINSIGRYDGAAAEMLRTDGEYYLLVSAGGAYEFRIEQPRPDNVTPVEEHTFSGEHQQVTPVFTLEAGTHTLRGTSDGTGNFFVWLYEVDDLGGAAIDGDYAGRLIVVTNGPANEAVTITLGQTGHFLVHVYASSIQMPTSKANWTVAIE
jgi:hypothetical protein